MFGDMQQNWLEPAATVIRKLGGLDEAAEAAGTDKSWVSRWRQPKSNGGTDGLIPAKYQPLLLEWAREKGRPLRPEDFFRTSSNHQAA